MVPRCPLLLILIILLFLFLSVTPCLADQQRSLLDRSDHFRPVYSTTVTGQVSPESPLRMAIDVRDDMTAFVRIFAFGPEGTNWTLSAGKGDDITRDPDLQVSDQGGYPRLVTLKDRSGKYVMVEPGNYTAIVSSDGSSGEATVKICYVYHTENLDKGNIRNQTWSSREITIPDGLERVLFITESVAGTDLDLFVQNGTTLPDSYTNVTWAETGSCSTCMMTGVDYYVPEALVIDSPAPGKYLMMTRACGGNDYFFTYWMGFEKEPGDVNETAHASPDNSVQENKADPVKYTGMSIDPVDRSPLSGSI